MMTTCSKTIFDQYSSMALLALALVSPVLARDCFYPDGTIPTDSNYVPCGPQDGPHSACCASGDGCSSTGYCFGSAGYMYRGGCTDKNWTAPECARHCKNGEQGTFTCAERHCANVEQWLFIALATSTHVQKPSASLPRTSAACYRLEIVAGLPISTHRSLEVLATT